MGDRHTAVQFFNNGVAASEDKTAPEYLQHAFQQFCSAMYIDPTWGTASYQAGNNASDLLHPQAAIACWRRAMECELPDVLPQDTTEASKAKVLCNLGWRLQTIGESEEAKQCLLRALQYDPSLAYVWLNLSIVQRQLGELQESVVSAKKAMELKPDDATISTALAFAHLFNRDLADGFKHFEARYAYRLKNFEKYPYPKWLGEKGKTIFLVSDQGLGDTLSMARFLRRTCQRAGYVHAAVHPELLRLMQHSLLLIPNLNLLPQPCNFPSAEAWTTFVSLPFALGLSDEEIRNEPQIVYEAPRTNAQQWKVPDRKLHIGIAWRGSPMNEINEHRSIPVTQFLDLYRVPGIQLYSLQVDGSKQQMHDAGCAPVIKDLSPYISDVTSTCSLLRDLDMVIACESSLGHICTMMKKEFWCPYSWLGRDYRIGFDGSDQLWSKYRVFSQGPDMRWQPVFDRIVEALKERINA